MMHMIKHCRRGLMLYTSIGWQFSAIVVKPTTSVKSTEVDLNFFGVTCDQRIPQSGIRPSVNRPSVIRPSVKCHGSSRLI